MKNLYNLFSCGRLSSGYQGVFKTSTIFFPAEGYPLPTQGLFKTSAIFFPAEGYPLPTQALFKSSTIFFPAEGYPLPNQGLFKSSTNFFPAEGSPLTNQGLFKTPTIQASQRDPPDLAVFWGGCPWCLLTDLRVAPLGADSAGFAVLCSSPRACTMTRRRCPPTVSVR